MAVVIINADAAMNAFGAWRARLSDFSVPLRRWATYMALNSVTKNFVAQGRPERWAPIKIRTIIARYMKTADAKKHGAPANMREPHPAVYKKARGVEGVGALSSVAGFARSAATGRVLRARHRGLNRFAPAGYVFRAKVVQYVVGRDGSSGAKILQATGTLYRSVTSDKDAIAADGKMRVVIGSNEAYAGTHQFGNPRLKIPARPYLMVHPEDEEEFAEMMTNWIQGV